MILTIAGIIVVLWLLGFLTHVGGNLIHILLLVALGVFIYALIVRGRTA